MAAGPNRSLLIDRARDLYAYGMELSEIARVLGVGADTLSEWRMFDRDRGRCWDEEREQVHSHSPERVLRALERRFAALVLDHEKAGDTKETKEQEDEVRKHDSAKDDKEIEGRLLNMVRIITGYRKTAGELTGQMRTMQELAVFCTENLPPEDLPPVRRALEMFVNHLREENR